MRTNLQIIKKVQLEFSRKRFGAHSKECISISGDSLSTVECFDPILGRWTVAEAMSTMRSRVGVAVLNGKD